VKALRTCLSIVVLVFYSFGNNGLAASAVRAIDAIGITVSDMSRSLAFYTEVLPFKQVAIHEVSGEAYERLTGVFGMRIKVARLQLGSEFIELIQYMTPHGRPIPIDSHSNDHWFQHIAIIVSDMSQAYQHLRRHHVDYGSPEPQRLPDWNPDAGGIWAFYFRDPDGNNLEILQFPEGKGAAKWHRPGKQLFLGIDHSAIVVADTESSLKYYRDALGLEVVGHSENYGIEQERLNNVFGARLRITALKAPLGPGVELLEYLTPVSGRPMPFDTQASDLWHWQIQTILWNDTEMTDTVLKTQTASVSSGVIELPDAVLGYSKAYLLRDPDGHATLLTKP